RMSAVSLWPLITEMTELVRPLASLRNIDLTMIPGEDGDIPIAHADANRLRQVLLNLLSDAVKYGNPDGTVAVGCRPRERGWRIFVSDDGAGIAPELLSRLFERFERLGATGSEIEGSGLGLSISRRLVE